MKIVAARKYEALRLANVQREMKIQYNASMKIVRFIKDILRREEEKKKCEEATRIQKEKCVRAVNIISRMFRSRLLVMRVGRLYRGWRRLQV